VCLLTTLPHLELIGTIARPLPPLLPPPHGSYPILDTQRPQPWISVTSSVWRLWVQKLILDSDGDCFLLLPIFDKTPVSRDIDCYSLAKISEILAGADILSTPIFVRFSAMRAGTNKPVQCRRESAHKSRAACGNFTHTSSRRSRKTSARSGRSQLLWTLPGQNSKEMLSCMRQHFVDA
jgi:hypothetical protein